MCTRKAILLIFTVAMLNSNGARGITCYEASLKELTVDFPKTKNGPLTCSTSVNSCFESSYSKSGAFHLSLGCGQCPWYLTSEKRCQECHGDLCNTKMVAEFKSQIPNSRLCYFALKKTKGSFRNETIRCNAAEKCSVDVDWAENIYASGCSSHCKELGWSNCIVCDSDLCNYSAFYFKYSVDVFAPRPPEAVLHRDGAKKIKCYTGSHENLSVDSPNNVTTCSTSDSCFEIFYSNNESFHLSLGCGQCPLYLTSEKRCQECHGNFCNTQKAAEFKSRISSTKLCYFAIKKSYRMFYNETVRCNTAEKCAVGMDTKWKTAVAGCSSHCKELGWYDCFFCDSELCNSPSQYFASNGAKIAKRPPDAAYRRAFVTKECYRIDHEELTIDFPTSAKSCSTLEPCFEISYSSAESFYLFLGCGPCPRHLSIEKQCRECIGNLCNTQKAVEFKSRISDSKLCNFAIKKQTKEFFNETVRCSAAEKCAVGIDWNQNIIATGCSSHCMEFGWSNCYFCDGELCNVVEKYFNSSGEIIASRPPDVILGTNQKSPAATIYYHFPLPYVDALSKRSRSDNFLASHSLMALLSASIVVCIQAVELC